MFAIEAVALRKSYPGGFRRKPFEALRGLDLTVPRGEAFGLLGPNGAGKTTFIKTLLSVARPSSGEVRVLGHSPEDERARARIGYLPERLQLPASWRPRAFLASVADLKGSREPASELGGLLERVGLGRDLDRRIGAFSKGMRQRLGLAAALVGRPDLLVLDEPTDGIDPVGRVEIRNLLLEEQKRGATLFINSHLLSETERLCGRVGILVQGRLAKVGSLEELTRRDSGWRVRLARPLAGPAVASAGFLPTQAPETCRFPTNDPEAFNEALDRLRSAGGLVVEVVRDDAELEDVLAEVIGPKAAA